MLLPIVCLGLALNEPVELVSETYDLATVLPPPAPAWMGIETMPLARASEREMGFEDFDEPSTIDVDTLLDLLINTVHPEEWEYEGRSIGFVDFGGLPRLVVKAPPEVQRDVSRFLDHFERAARRAATVEVRVFRVPVVDGRLGSVLENARHDAARRVSKLLEGDLLEPRATFRLRLPSGHPAARAAVERNVYLRDLDVEIAQGAAVHGPVMDRYALGVSLALKAEVGRQGRALVTFAVSDAWEREPPERVRIENEIVISSEAAIHRAPGGGTIECPRVHFATLAGSARLSAGQSAAVFAALPPGGGAPAGVLVTIELLEVAPEPGVFEADGRALVLRHVAGDVSSGIRIPRFGMDAIRFPWNQFEQENALPATIGIRANGGGDEMVQNALETIYMVEEAELGADYRGGMLFVMGPTDVVGPAALGAEREIPVPGDVPPLLAELARPGAQASAPLFLASADAGDALIVAGIQETYVTACDVDVANNSSVANPVVEGILSGYAARVHTSGGLKGKSSVAVFLTSQLRIGGKNAVDASIPQVSLIHEPRFASGLLDLDEAMRPGDRVDLGAIPLPADGEAAHGRVSMELLGSE